jgi:type IX secretion system PorP/SprF family membrane protein
MFNPYLVNPAAAGTRVYSPVMLTYRNQWTGFKGAPQTYTLSGHTALPNHLGAGAIFFRDDTGGAISRTGVELTGTYKADLTNTDQVCFGLSAVLGQFQFNNDSLVYYDPGDLALQGGMESTFNLDFNFGFLVIGENYFFGFSVPYVIQNNLKVETNAGAIENQNVRHYMLMGSYAHVLNDDWSLQPSLLTRFTASTPVQLDLNVRTIYKELLWGGISYRHRDAVALLVGIDWNDFVLGYAYDITVTDARSFSPHTHEVSIGYNIQTSGVKRSGFGNGRVLKRSRIRRR